MFVSLFVSWGFGRTDIYGYMTSDVWLRTILIVREETRCRHIGYSFRLSARVLLYAPSHRQDSTYNGLCYTSRGALAETRNSSMGPPMKDRSDDPSHHERTLLPRSYISLWGFEVVGVCFVFGLLWGLGFCFCLFVLGMVSVSHKKNY